MPSAKQPLLLTLYAIGHFVIDLLSAFLMISLLLFDAEAGPLCLLVYNFCAFALQMPAGLLADRLDRNAGFAVAGLLLCLLAAPFFGLPLLCAALAGIGNCLYHVGGGVAVLHFSDRRQWMLGVYVSPGALGLFLGTLLAQWQRLSLPLAWLCAAGAVLFFSFCLHKTSPLHRLSGNPPASLTPVGRAPLVAFFALFLVVVLRSYVGLTQVFPWKTGLWAVLAVSGLALGKAAGGFLADRFGALRTALVTLSFCGIFFLFPQNAACGLLGIFLFNMTMPLTLFAMAQLFPGARGFAFGTLTFALFLGYLPTWLGLPVPFVGKGWWYATEALLSLLLLAVGLLAGCRKSAHDRKKRGGGDG